MQYLKRFIQNARTNPKTTAGGMAGTILCIVGAVKNPAVLATVEWWSSLFISGALLVAADQQPAPPKADDETRLP